MKKRFFFDGVDILGNQLSIDQTVQNTIPVFSNPAPATTIIVYGAKVSAEQTMNLRFLSFFIQQSFMHTIGISQNL